jgi:hypothetical protein
MERREFITLLGGAAAAWPRAVRAQSATRKVQRIGIIDNSPSWEPFRQQLRPLFVAQNIGTPDCGMFEMAVATHALAAEHGSNGSMPVAGSKAAIWTVDSTG